MKLLTDRLILRDIEKRDKKDLIEGIGNIKISRYLLVVPHPYTSKDADWWFNHCKEKPKNKPRKDYTLVIEYRPEKKTIGAVGLSDIDYFQGTATFGYWLNENYWRKGIMTEAVRKMMDFGFNKLKLRRINVCAYTENEASNGLIKSLGFKHEGTKRKACRAKSTGKIHDENIYGMLKSEYKKR